MQLNIYSIRDDKSDIYGPLFACHTHGEAERRLRDLLKNPETQVNQYPEDFNLYYFGTMDNVTGKTEFLDSPQHQIKAINLKALEPKSH